jgi:uncharacterized protein (TIGR03435 family)
MQALDDMTLLREYAARNSETAFEELVSRRAGYVYAMALRQVRDPHLAEEVTQAVFIILAQKAGRLSNQTLLTGWLFKTTRYAALAQRRAAARRQRREQEAQMQNELHTPAPDPLGEQVSPLLDEALATLGEKDRQAVLLRFLENKSLAEVGSWLGTGEDPARKRVSRALEKLRRYFDRRGVSSTTAMIAGALSANALPAVPAALVKTISTVAIAKGSVAAASTLALVKGTLNLMAWIKTKTAMIIGAGVLMAAGAATWQAGGPTGLFDRSVLEQEPPQVKIVASKFTAEAAGNSADKRMGTGLPAPAVVAMAYGFDTPARTILAATLPEGRYDFIASLPQGNAEALQREVKRQFGVVARRERRETDVWLLKVKATNAAGLKPSGPNPGEYMLWRAGSRLDCQRLALAGLTSEIEFEANIPILDRTGLTNRYDFVLNCKATDLVDRRWDNVNAALDPLGLELVPGRESIEMLVVEQAR